MYQDPGRFQWSTLCLTHELCILSQALPEGMLYITNRVDRPTVNLVCVHIESHSIHPVSWPQHTLGQR